MNLPEEQIEGLLRQAPRPTPTPGLRATLIAQAPATARSARPASIHEPLAAWLRRWRPALATTALAVLGLAVLGYQQVRLTALRTALDDLQAEPASHPTAPTPAPPAAPNPAAVVGALDPAELDRLRIAVATLKREVDALESLRAENAQLRNRATTGTPTPEETDALLKARDRARSIACVNNLKMLGLAVRVWAVDHNETLPPDLLTLTNEIGSPKLLTCPGDTGRTAAAHWATFTPAALSYEFLAPGAAELDPQRVIFRCPIHGSVTLGDGSVHMALAATRPERFVERDGKLFLGEPHTPKPSSATPDPRLLERYGLLPPGAATPPPPAPTP
jgi:hypothetical protein